MPDTLASGRRKEWRQMQREEVDRQAVAIVLARALAQRLAAAVPPGITVSSRGGNVIVGDGSTSGGTGVVPLVDQPGDLEENVTTAASAVLNRAQDVVVEHLARWWPSSPDSQPGTFESGADLPLPAAKVEGRLLRLWFGDPDRPVLELEPIDLAELT
jgi:hypothetical protein